MKNPILYGDYRTALDEAEPRLYEDIQDFDASKALFQEVYCVFTESFISSNTKLELGILFVPVFSCMKLFSFFNYKF